MSYTGREVKAVVVIPVYKSLNDYTDGQRASLANSFSVLRHHATILIAPPGLDVSAYKELAKHHQVFPAVRRFDEQYFQGLATDGDLLLNARFYKLIKSFTHVLICYPGAWVFYDELDSWCKLNYSFVSSPAFAATESNNSYQFKGIGNGGFSLRKVSHCRRILARINWMFVLRQTIGNNMFERFRRTAIFKQMFSVKSHEYLIRLLHSDTTMEGEVWGIWVPEIFSDFYVPIPHQAMNFSFDIHPSYLYSLTKRKLPFGCIAWEENEPDFWKEHINFKNVD